jgi:small GTP-binding protein
VCDRHWRFDICLESKSFINRDHFIQNLTAIAMSVDPIAHKVVIIGDSAVGKTSIIRCFDEQTFNPRDTPTVGASFISKKVVVQGGSVILNIWDTAGQERYRSLIPTYAHGAQAAILCYDVTSLQSFESLNAWLDFLQRLCSPDCLLYVVGNKIDLKPVVPQAQATKWADDHNAQCVFTSAQQGTAVQDLFRAIAESVSSRQTHMKRLVEQGRGGSECCS